MSKLRLAFCWQGVSDKKIYEHWKDGLFAAIQLIKKDHEVVFNEPWDEIKDVDVILYWEAPVTAQGQNAPHYNKVRSNPIKKILLFAGGPINPDWIKGFDLLLLESKVNEKECDDWGIPWQHAFGINTDIFNPLNLKKKYKAICFGTCASWKRQGLFGIALKSDGVVCGRGQESDGEPFRECARNNVTMFGELPYEEVNKLVNESHCSVNCASEWGGGQRQTLESLAAGIPVICMTDSPKNREFVEESGCGLVVKPEEEEIRKAVEEVMSWTDEKKKSGIKYVREKFSHEIYAQQILKGIQSIL